MLNADATRAASGGTFGLMFRAVSLIVGEIFSVVFIISVGSIF
jgi:hypothetical protein